MSGGARARTARLHAEDPRCHYCGAVTRLAPSGGPQGSRAADAQARAMKSGRARGVKWTTLDHLLPRSLGGGMVGENTTLACEACNWKKGSDTHDEFCRAPGCPLRGRATRALAAADEEREWQTRRARAAEFRRVMSAAAVREVAALRARDTEALVDCLAVGCGCEVARLGRERADDLLASRLAIWSRRGRGRERIVAGVEPMEERLPPPDLAPRLSAGLGALANWGARGDDCEPAERASLAQHSGAAEPRCVRAEPRSVEEGTARGDAAVSPGEPS